MKIKNKGDLTDAKNSDLSGSKQYEYEWKMYSKIVSENPILKNTPWLDVRGNHGSFHNFSWIQLIIQPFNVLI